jgi:hypothetical protein
MGLGNKELAIEYLQKSLETRDYVYLPWSIKNEAFAELRSDPQFQEIERKLSLPQ